jgi:alpha-L-fucosidase 2
VASRDLGRDETFAGQVTAVRARLAPTPVGRYGQIQEWLEDWDDPQDRHRHASQLYGLYPGSEIAPDSTPGLVKAARITLEHRGLASTGWSTAWKIAFFARMRDGETANRILQYLLNYRPIRKEDQGEGAHSGGVYPNLLSICPPMQIDANFGACAGIAEMLLQSYAGELHLLPALPKSWSAGEVKGLCARGGFEVGMAWSNGQLTKASVLSKLGKPCAIRYGDARLRFNIRAGETCSLKYSGTLTKTILRK